MPLISIPFSTVCVDLVGPINPPSDGYRYILTLIDVATRYPEAVPLKISDTFTVAESMLGIVSRIGLPQKVHSDRGSLFTSDMMKEVYRLLAVKQYKQIY